MRIKKSKISKKLPNRKFFTSTNNYQWNPIIFTSNHEVDCPICNLLKTKNGSNSKST